MTEIQKADKAIRAMIDDPSTHYWIANAMRTALSKDPTDATDNFATATELFANRLAAMETN